LARGLMGQAVAGVACETAIPQNQIEPTTV